MSLPWKPKDLRNHLVVFRRKELNKDTYVEDLYVRRNMISRILRLLTTTGCRGEGHEHEPLHQYYTAFEWCQENLDALPENDVPEDLHFEDFDEDPKQNILTEDEFVTWLTEGRFDLELSQLCPTNGYTMPRLKILTLFMTISLRCATNLRISMKMTRISKTLPTISRKHTMRHKHT